MIGLLPSPPPAPSVEVRSAASVVVQSSGSALAPFLLVNRSSRDRTVRVTFDGRGCRADAPAVEVTIEGLGWRSVAAPCRLDDAADAATLSATVGPSSASVRVIRGLDLTTLPWKRTFAPRETPHQVHLALPETDDEAWPELRVPALWGDNRYAWCRVKVTIPAAWQGRDVRLSIGAVDDNDITYLNGVEIGRTNGWDTPREYMLPPAQVRWGQSNVITVMVDNPTFGGGIHKAPVMLLVGRADPGANSPSVNVPGRRPSAGRIGKPLPLRRMHVREGVLRYPDGAEVALWGVNIYPQSWHQYENMKRLKLDIKETIRTDFDHLQQMGVEAIRIHVFDREISDAKGHILDNEHLDLLDFVVSECSRRGIYLYFTPIAWWGGPNENKDSFSARTSKPGMMFAPEALAAAANYLKEFLARKNRYTGRAYKDEPSLCVLEVMNEPTYFLYGDIAGSAYPPQGESPEVLERDHRIFREQWHEWCASLNAEPNSALFPLFRYDRMRRYVRGMVAAIRSTGARQPIAISYFGVNGDDITQAIADSECDAVTFSNYPGGWERVNDGHNLLHTAAPLSVDPRLAGKARLAYEFDTPATNTSCYLYPALAAHFRAGDVQIACQFQYDSIGTARWNLDWHAHWLNWHYTPTKAVSFMVGGEAFRSLPRGAAFDVGDWQSPAPSLALGGMLSSFSDNNSLFVAGDRVVYARPPGDLGVFNWPEAPRRIVGTGSSRYVDYSGTGAYVLDTVAPGRLRLILNPDVRLIGDSLAGSMGAPVAELEHKAQRFRLLLPGWGDARCLPVGGSPTVRDWADADRQSPIGWALQPGLYEIHRMRR